MPSVEDITRLLTLDDILEVIAASPPEPESFRVVWRLKHNKNQLVEKLLADSPRWKTALLAAVERKELELHAKKQKRRADWAEQQRNSRQATHEAASEAQRVPTEPSDSHFLEPVSQSQIHSCYEAFYNATTKDALRSKICGVCARELNARDAKFSEVSPSSLPHPNRLRPLHSREGQFILEGRILERAGCIKDGESWKVNACKECLDELTVCL